MSIREISRHPKRFTRHPVCGTLIKTNKIIFSVFHGVGF